MSIEYRSDHYLTREQAYALAAEITFVADALFTAPNIGLSAYDK